MASLWTGRCDCLRGSLFPHSLREYGLPLLIPRMSEASGERNYAFEVGGTCFRAITSAGRDPITLLIAAARE